MKRAFGAIIAIILAVGGLAANPTPSYAAPALELDMLTCTLLQQGEACQFLPLNYPADQVAWDISPLTTPTDEHTHITAEGLLYIGAHEIGVSARDEAHRHYFAVRGWLKSDKFNVQAVRVGIYPAGVDRDSDTWPGFPECWGPEGFSSFAKAPKPAISGTAKVGKTLTVSVGTWSPKPILVYRWFRQGAEITGATKSSYTLVGADAGKRITAKVIGSKSGYETTTTYSVETKTVAKGTFKASVPKISGTRKVGHALTAAPNAWTKGTKLSYQWYRSGKKISKATKPTYKLVAADKGKTIKIKVTGKKAGYTTTTRTSGSTGKIKAGTLATGTIEITGTPQVGQTLTVKRGTWTAGTKYSYQWFAGAKKISKATKSTFTLTNAQKGKTITVKVTGQKAGYATVTKTSAATASVA